MTARARRILKVVPVLVLLVACEGRSPSPTGPSAPSSFRELSASKDEIDGVPLIPSACVPPRGGQADAHPIFKRPESSLA